VGTSDGDTDATTVAAAAATAAAIPSCCGPVDTAVSRGGSPVVTALVVACGALRECRLVVTGAPDLSAFAGARAGMSSITLRMRKHEGEHRPLKFRVRAGSTADLKLEKPRFLFLEGSGGAAVVPAGSAMALAGTSAVLASASAALADPSTDVLVVDASTPATGACSTATTAARGDGGGGFHLSGGPAPVTLLFLFRPCCSCSQYSSLCCSWCSSRLIPLSLERTARSCSRRCAARAAARARGVGGFLRAASTVTLC
jgi:hypothetical protein